MEDSIIMSSTNNMTKSLISPRSNDNIISSSHHQDESGWTWYLEDFVAKDCNKEYVMCSCGCHYCSLSTLSTMVYDDKASPAMQLQERTACLPLHRSCCDGLISAKRKARSSFVDHELEDTATSPIHSSKEKRQGASLEHGEAEAESKQSINMGLMITELRRKGLCLVPVSLLLNHLN